MTDNMRSTYKKEINKLIGINIKGYMNNQMPDMESHTGRWTVCLLIDTSLAMMCYSAIFRESLVKLIETVANNSVAGEIIDLGIITYNGKEISVWIDIQELYYFVDDVMQRIKPDIDKQLIFRYEA